MRRRICLLTLLVLLTPGCTLLRGEPEPTLPPVTATLPDPLQTEIAQAERAVTATAEAERLASLTPPATDTPIPSPTAPPTQAPPTAAPTLTPAPAPRQPPTPIPPTRTIPGPTAAPALDDGSGGAVPGTGSQGVAFSPVPGVDALPDTLYFLSDDGAQLQVWRLRVGANHPEQLTYSPNGVAAFDVAPDGTLAYITPAGHLIADGVPVTPPSLPGGALPPVVDLAWSPDGLWLAYLVQSAAPPEGEHPVDGLWLRSTIGSSSRLAASVYAAAGGQAFSRPLRWRPGASELLVGVDQGDGVALALVDTQATRLTALWRTAGETPPDAAWTADGAAAVVGDGERIVRYTPGSAEPAALFDPAESLEPRRARPLSSGTLSFVGRAANGGLTVYRLAPGADAPTALIPPVAAGSGLDVLWDSAEQEALLVITQPADAPLGAGYWLDAGRMLHELTPLTGPLAAPRWGPLFQAGDSARIQTPDGNPLNLRNAPGGEVIAGLLAGSSVRVMAGPTGAGDNRWWQVRTADGRTGWVVDSIAQDGGGSLRALLPVG